MVAAGADLEWFGDLQWSNDSGLMVLNMTATCPTCTQPTASAGMSCSSCVGAAHQRKARSRSKGLDRVALRAPADMTNDEVMAAVRATTDGDVPARSRRAMVPPAEPAIAEPPVYQSVVPMPGRDAEGRNANGGLKYSAGKMRPSLFPVLVFWEIVKVLTFGAAKYTKDGVDGGDNWQKNSPRDYLEAAERHLAEWKMGRDSDPESSCHTLAHCICDLVFLTWFELTGRGMDRKL